MATTVPGACPLPGGVRLCAAPCRCRVDHCPHMETKTFCSACKTHCYKPQMREAIRQVMRWSGPRMIFHHPVLAIRHLIETKKQKK